VRVGPWQLRSRATPEQEKLLRNHFGKLHEPRRSSANRTGSLQSALVLCEPHRPSASCAHRL
jgi:hypothetical protein